MGKPLPMKQSLVFTEQLNIRVEPELKENFRKLSYLGVDVPELIRRSVKETLDQALKALPADK